MRTLSGVAVGLVLAVVATAGAQDIAGRKELKRADLGGAPGMEVVTSIVEFKPGETIPLHSHHGIESAYVVQGATLQKPGQAPRVLATGASVMVQRDVVHGGDTVMGTASLRLYTVHVVDKDKALYEPAGK